MASIKCNICRKTKTADDFLKNGKTLKSCVACREKIKKKKDKKDDSDTTSVSDLSEKDPSDELQNVIMPLDKHAMDKPAIAIDKPAIAMDKPHLITPAIPKINKPKLWYGLSGKWVKMGDEERLHKMFMKKIIRELKKSSALPIHKYLTKYIMVDIRDRYCSE